ncbi:MAG: DUF695 domain-containing protein [Myxococcota bacterium]
MNVEKWGWSVAEISERESDAVAFMVRWRQVPAGVARRQWPTLLHIVWENRFSNRDGFPVEREQEAMGTFELRLGEAVERDGLAVMSLALTGEGKREYLFHTRDVAEFSRRLHEMPQEEQRYPIILRKAEDPEWRAFDEVFARFELPPPKPPTLWDRLKGMLG